MSVTREEISYSSGNKWLLMGKLTKIKAYRVVWFLFFMMGLYSCEKFEPERIAKIETGTVSGVTSSSCIASGTIIDAGGEPITEYGHCWSEEINPTIENDRYKFYNKSSAGRFIGNINGLKANTKYYVRAYASSSKSTIYGGFRDFTTLSDETVSDIDGNIYSMVAIGTQVWMRENLKTTKFNNGDLIGTTTPANLNVSGETNPVYQWANNGEESNVDLYGRLYTWYTVTDARKLCPTGWHVPSREEWTTLVDNLGGAGIAGGKIKESGIIHWDSPNTDASNESGFTALPGGLRWANGTFWHMGGGGYLWSTSQYSPDEAWYMYLFNNSTAVLEVFISKKNAYSVRCLKD